MGQNVEHKELYTSSTEGLQSTSSCQIEELQMDGCVFLTKLRQVTGDIAQLYIVVNPGFWGSKVRAPTYVRLPHHWLLSVHAL